MPNHSPGPWIKIGNEIRTVNGKIIATASSTGNRNAIAALPAMSIAMRVARDAIAMESEHRYIGKELAMARKLIISVIRWSNGQDPDGVFLETMRDVAKEYDLTNLWQEKLKAEPVKLEFEPDEDSPFRPPKNMRPKTTSSVGSIPAAGAKASYSELIEAFLYENADKDFSVLTIAQRIGLGSNMPTIYAALRKLLDRGLVQRTRRGRFSAAKFDHETDFIIAPSEDAECPTPRSIPRNAQRTSSAPSKETK